MLSTPNGVPPQEGGSPDAGPTVIDEFIFERSPEALHRDIVVAVALSAH
jgi:hypothetical protein